MSALSNGFTFIELLVVIAIIATVGVLTLATNGAFGEDTKLKNGSLDIQSFVRTAITNSSTNTVCSGVNGARWIVKFTSLTSIDLVCQPSGGVESASLKNLNLTANSLTIDTIVNGNCTATLPTRISFEPLSNTTSFSDNINQACISSASSLTVNIKNTKTQRTAAVTINKGGTVDVK